MPKRDETPQSPAPKADVKKSETKEPTKKVAKREVPETTPATKKESPEHKKVMELAKHAGVKVVDVEERGIDLPEIGKRNAVFMQFENGVQGVKDMLYAFHTIEADFTGWFTEVVGDDILCMYHA